jgi:hypothetical protein
MTEQMIYALHGASAAVFVIAGLLFARYGVNQRERLFGFFAAAFWCFALGYLIRVATDIDEHRPYIFLPRLLGFLLIIAAIVDKNRRARAADRPAPDDDHA